MFIFGIVYFCKGIKMFLTMIEIQYLCATGIIFLYPFPYPFCTIADKHQWALCWEYFYYLIKEIHMVAQVRHIIRMPDKVAVFGDMLDPVAGSKSSAEFHLFPRFIFLPCQDLS